MRPVLRVSKPQSGKMSQPKAVKQWKGSRRIYIHGYTASEILGLPGGSEVVLNSAELCWSSSRIWIDGTLVEAKRGVIVVLELIVGSP